jgi:hypothetical protein
MIASGGIVLETDTAVLILVVVGLALLARSVVSLRREVAALKSAGPPAALKSAAPAAPAAAPSGPSPKVRAAIAAAIHAAFGPGARVISISASPSMLWSQEGRRQVFQSHRIR